MGIAGAARPPPGRASAATSAAAISCAIPPKTERAAEPNGTVPFKPLTKAIVFGKVSFSYRTGREVLTAIDLKIPVNTTVAFVGGSGAGKSGKNEKEGGESGAPHAQQQRSQ